ncbi:MAG TPA: phosphatase PAP2 family protein [Terriglobales bacterium]|nr:phosphatase PAP2 family protein [Terriglobales bacterium]
MNRHSAAGLRILVLLLLGCGINCAAQTQINAPSTGCLPATATQLHNDATGLGHGLMAAPRNAIRPQNLKWELPIAAATGILIAEVDGPVNSHNRSISRQNTASTWSNVGLGMEFGTAGLMWLDGCARHHDSLRENGWTALEAAGAAAGINEVFKFAANRQYPIAGTGSGEFWDGGKSFPSGHSAASWAFASVLAHRYPHKRWVKWGAYGFATAVSLSRLASKKHFPSDVLVGSTIGYVTGTYLAGR